MLRRLVLLLLLWPATAKASCLDRYDPAYGDAVNQGHFEAAFRLVARELNVSAADERHFMIIEGFGRTHDERNGQADPDTLELHLDPDLFSEGKNSACQGVAHELAHLRQFERDRRALHTFYATHPAVPGGWTGCDHGPVATKSQAEKEAYGCLEDNDFVLHAAAEEIEAVMAQRPYSWRHRLREEDYSYLLENIKRWADSSSLVGALTNESYYPSELRLEDRHTFCRGAEFAREDLADSASVQRALLAFCQTTL